AVPPLAVPLLAVSAPLLAAPPAVLRAVSAPALAVLACPSPGTEGVFMCVSFRRGVWRPGASPRGWRSRAGRGPPGLGRGGGGGAARAHPGRAPRPAGRARDRSSIPACFPGAAGGASRERLPCRERANMRQVARLIGGPRRGRLAYRRRAGRRRGRRDEQGGA